MTIDRKEILVSGEVEEAMRLGAVRAFRDKVDADLMALARGEMPLNFAYANTSRYATPPSTRSRLRSWLGWKLWRLAAWLEPEVVE